MSGQTQKQILDFSIQALIFVLILTVYVVLSYLIQLKNIKFLHQSTVAIVMGVLTAVFCKYVLHITISFSNEIFFSIILPPIVFSAGFSLRKSMFYKNIGLISFFGIIGTIIGFILITLVLLFLDRVIFHSLSLSQLMIISSVLCATDTVASMTLIKPERFPILNAVLFGQSIINDAVAIILFRAVSGHLAKDQQFQLYTLMTMMFSFIYLFFFSLLLGIVSGLFISYIFRKFTFFSRYPIKQTSIILLGGYFTYLLGEILSFSGIITLFVQSIIIGHYAFMNLSEQSKKGTGMAFQTVSYMAEAFVFAYLGASILSIAENWKAVLMAFCLVLFLPLVRAVMVYILPCFFKIFKKKFYLKPKQLKVCWFSGMIRGVIAFALCLQIESIHKQFITSLVLIVVLVTTVGGSSFLNKYIELIKLQKTQTCEQLQNLNEKKIEGIQCKEEMNDNEVHREQAFQNEEKRWNITKKLIYFQKKYMRPFFGKVQQTEKTYSSDRLQRQNMNQKNLKQKYNNEDINTNKIKQGYNVQLKMMSPSGSQKSGSQNFNDWKPFEQNKNK